MKRTAEIAILLILSLAGSFVPAFATPVQKTAEEHGSRYKRLVLKDGSYELVGEYSIRGDRVHYFSTERHVWEDLPYSLIDWPATEQYAAMESQSQAERAEAALDRAAKERRGRDARFPLVATGLRLPSSDGVFLLDTYRGEPELNHLIQNGADLKKNLGRNILRGIINPIASSKQTVELQGRHARIQAHTSTPSIFVSIDGSDSLQGYTSDTAKDHLRIVRCELKNENRIVGSIDIAIYGKVKQRAGFVDAKVEPVSEYWVKITPAVPLESGEYALVEFDEKGALNQFVWDFGVDAGAPRNSNTIGPAADKDEPVLILKSRKSGKK